MADFHRLEFYHTVLMELFKKLDQHIVGQRLIKPPTFKKWGAYWLWLVGQSIPKN